MYPPDIGTGIVNVTMEENDVDLTGKRRRSDSTSQSHDGSPWKAMKRLRVEEENTNHHHHNHNIYFHDQTTTAVTSPFVLLPSSPSMSMVSETEQQHYQQDAGQMSTEAEWMLPVPAQQSILRKKNSKEDIDYKNVNHILGSLHLERRQREQQFQQQQEQQNKGTNNNDSNGGTGSNNQYPLYNTDSRYHQQQQQQQHQQTNSAVQYHKHKNKVVSLHTSSKLG